MGAGDGYFTLRLVERVGETGKVYASDIDNRALQVIRDKCRDKNIANVSVIQGTETDPKLPEQRLDMVLMVNVIHLVQDPSTFLKNIARSLKSDAKLVFVQWDEEKMSTAMDLDMRGCWDPEDRALYSLQTNLRTIYAGGFEVTRIIDFLPLQRIYVCIPGGD